MYSLFSYYRFRFTVLEVRKKLDPDFHGCSLKVQGQAVLDFDTIRIGSCSLKYWTRTVRLCYVQSVIVNE